MRLKEKHVLELRIPVVPVSSGFGLVAALACLIHWTSWVVVTIIGGSALGVWGAFAMLLLFGFSREGAHELVEIDIDVEALNEHAA